MGLVVMGTLGGFPCPPAMGSVERSSPAPDAMDGRLDCRWRRSAARRPPTRRKGVWTPDGVGTARVGGPRRDGWASGLQMASVGSSAAPDAMGFLVMAVAVGWSGAWLIGERGGLR